MASYVFSRDAFKIDFSLGERRAMARPNLSLEKSRLLSADMAKFPERPELGKKISKIVLFQGVSGEYRSGSRKILVFGKPRGSELSLRIRIAHPNVDEIWVCGAKAAPLQKQLQAFIKSTGDAAAESS